MIRAKRATWSAMYHTLRGLGRERQVGVFRGRGYADTHTIGPYKVQIDEDESYVEFFIWNPDRPCVMIMLDKSDQTAVLEILTYDPRCTTDFGMKRGSGTRAMLQFAFETIQAHGATRIQLMDKSTIVCDGKRVQLGIMSFLQYGETWYERTFGFRAVGRYAERYERAKQTRLAKLDLAFIRRQPCSWFADVDDLRRTLDLDYFESITWELRVE